MGEAIGHFGPPVLFIGDLERSKAFYVDALGFRLAFGDSTSAGLFLGDEMFLLVTVPSAEDMLAGETLGTPKDQLATGLFNIFVENVDETFEQLKVEGHRVHRGSDGPRVGTPDGALQGSRRRRVGDIAVDRVSRVVGGLRGVGEFLGSSAR